MHSSDPDCETMDVIRPIDGRSHRPRTLADEGTRARSPRLRVETYGRSTKEEAPSFAPAAKAVSARIDDRTAAMVEEYGGVVQFAGLIVVWRRRISGSRAGAAEYRYAGARRR